MKHAAVSVTVLLISLTSQASAEAEAYLCVEQSVGGVNYDPTAGSWNSTTFTPEKKWLIRRPDPSKHPLADVYRDHPGTDVSELTKGWVWEVAPYEGNDFPIPCEKDFHESGILVCGEALGGFQFNRNNGRFLMSTLAVSYPALGVEFFDKGSLTESDLSAAVVAIGKCDAL